MADIAQMRFRSVKSPSEYGIMALADDGTFRLVPSDEFRDEMARLEEVALQRAQTFGVRTGIVLLTFGGLALGVGWLVGRIFGKLGANLSAARPLSEVSVKQRDGGGIRVQIGGAGNRFQTVVMTFNPDEVLQLEAEAFVAKIAEMKQADKDTGPKTR